MKNLKLTISYNGANFYGWQKQDGFRTVQGVLEDAFFRLTNENVVVEGSGRTDRGVHALGQVASVKGNFLIPTNKIKLALNNLLPEDVCVKSVEEVDENFHARFSAKKKTYKYFVQVGGTRNAIKSSHLAFYPYEDVDLKSMQDSAKILIGKHNFKAFCSAETQVKDFEREIFDIKIKKHGRIFSFEVSGNGFLYNMVRIIVGTLLEIGREKNPDKISKILSSQDRKNAGQTMPACGLYLKSVEYKK